MDNTIGNQQVTQTQLAWLAGIWDGDGHFSIRRTAQGNKKAPQYSPRIGICSADPITLTEIRRILDVLNIGYYFREKGQGDYDGSKKQVWLVAIETMTNAVKLITAIKPYLIGKLFQADCILEYCERRIKVADRKKVNNNQRKYTEREFELVRLVYDANGDQRGTSETIVQDAQRAKI